MPKFDSVEMMPVDPILGLIAAFKEDPRKHKVNLGIGVYQDAQGNSQVLQCVRKAEKALFNQQLDKDYLPIQGHPEFVHEVLKLIFGAESPGLEKDAIFGAQTLGGTGALRIGGEFLKRTGISDTIYFSNPTWANHSPIFLKSGMQTGTYDYYEPAKHRLSFPAMLNSLETLPTGKTLLLQPCCHNPTGSDPTFEEWKKISEVMKERQLIPFFDLAYLGFASGMEQDAKVIRYFEQEGHEMLLSFSCSKNFGLYGERVGFLAVVAKSKMAAEKVGSQVRQVIRGNYSTPPLHGQRIVTEILKSAELNQLWQGEVEGMRRRMVAMRSALAEKLEKFSFLRDQKGMFSLAGIKPEQVQKLRQDCAIYLPQSGRINVGGLNGSNLDYIVTSMLAATHEKG